METNLIRFIIKLLNYFNVKKLNLLYGTQLYSKYIVDFVIGDWGLGIGDWGLGPIPNPQSPIPNPQSPIFFLY